MTAKGVVHPLPLRQPSTVEAVLTYASGFAYGLVARRCRGLLLVSSVQAGSELLVQLLDEQPHLRCELERSLTARLSPRAYLRGSLVRGYSATRCRAWGVTITDAQLVGADEGVRDQFIRRAAADGFTIVHLTRRDRLTQALDLLVALKAHAPREGDDADVGPAVVDVAELIYLLYQLEEHEQRVRRLVDNVPRLEIVYEDDLADDRSQQATVDRICSVIGLDPAVIREPARLRSPRLTLDSVENIADLIDGLAHTRFAELTERTSRNLDRRPQGSRGTGSEHLRSENS